jgi:hypothetical protein
LEKAKQLAGQCDFWTLHSVSSESLPGLDPGRVPVRVKKTRQNKRIEPVRFGTGSIAVF